MYKLETMASLCFAFTPISFFVKAEIDQNFKKIPLVFARSIYVLFSSLKRLF